MHGHDYEACCARTLGSHPFATLPYVAWTVMCSHVHLYLLLYDLLLYASLQVPGRLNDVFVVVCKWTCDESIFTTLRTHGVGALQMPPLRELGWFEEILITIGRTRNYCYANSKPLPTSASLVVGLGVPTSKVNARGKVSDRVELRVSFDMTAYQRLETEVDVTLAFLAAMNRRVPSARPSRPRDFRKRKRWLKRHAVSDAGDAEGASGDSCPTGNEEAASTVDVEARSRAPRAKSRTEVRVNTDCPARIQLNFDGSASGGKGAWVVVSVCNEHNHPPTVPGVRKHLTDAEVQSVLVETAVHRVPLPAIRSRISRDTGVPITLSALKARLKSHMGKATIHEDIQGCLRLVRDDPDGFAVLRFRRLARGSNPGDVVFVMLPGQSMTGERHAL